MQFKLIFQTFWRVHCCNCFLFFEFSVLAYFFLLNCPKFQPNWTNLKISVLKFFWLDKKLNQIYKISNIIFFQSIKLCTIYQHLKIGMLTKFGVSCSIHQVLYKTQLSKSENFSSLFPVIFLSKHISLYALSRLRSNLDTTWPLNSLFGF